jgi:hypothetical protein
MHLRVGLNSGGAGMPQSLAPLNKPVIRKIIAEDGGDIISE